MLSADAIRIEDPSLPNLTDDRVNEYRSDRDQTYGAIYSYHYNKDGSIHVRTMWAGLPKIGSGGRRYATLEQAAEAVREARALVSAKWSRERRMKATIGWRIFPAIPHTLVN